MPVMTCATGLFRPRAPDMYCAACRHNQHDSRPVVAGEFATAGARLRQRNIGCSTRCFSSGCRSRLKPKARPAWPSNFSPMPDPPAPSVMTGHADGVITINLAEADDAERERRRQQMGELYRTLLGHFRHEIGHYFWDRLVADTPHLDGFPRLFGDERQDYAASLKNYYAHGAPADWSEHFISAYASSHPWEDFAETWAHYFHMADTLETAYVTGLAVNPKLPHSPGAVFDFHPRDTDMKRLVEAWLALTFAVNSLNRSMGLHDLYPFVLGPLAVAKLTFVQQRIAAMSPRTSQIRGGGEPGAKRDVPRRLRSETL